MKAPKDMLKIARQCLQNAYAPYSNFYVGACIKTTGGELFGGCNIEDASFSLTLCAEASALGAMISAGKRDFKEILIIANSEQFCPPCGACRQRFYEFCRPETIFHLCTQEGEYQRFILDDLLPFAFNATIWRKHDAVG